MMQTRLAFNIESSDDLSALPDTYHPTAQAIAYVQQLAEAAMDGGGAYVLQGPFGAGKSSLAGFALNQLARCNQAFTPRPTPHLFCAQDDSVAQIQHQGGLTVLALTGSATPLAYRLATALQSFVARNIEHDAEDVISSARSFTPETVTHDQILHLVSSLRHHVRHQGSAGMLFVIDEFGRHLDHMLEAATNDNDFHLLQSLAEMTGHQGAPFSLVLIQHYGLEHYSDRFYGDRRIEWDKVRGRFREIILQNSDADSAHIIGKLLAHDIQRAATSLPSIAASGVHGLSQDTAFFKAAIACRPLHPMTVLLLSRLARLLGQQERTIVGWLSSPLASGFNAARVSAGDGWIYPDVLFDHFMGDVMALPSNPVLANRFATIHGAAERMSNDISPEARSLFHILAMLGFCAGRGLVADETTAAACLPRGFLFHKHVAELTGCSLIAYRHFRAEYVIWGGSDYDIASRIETQAATAPVQPVDEMNLRVSHNILAHSHLVRTGNRRSAVLHWLAAGAPLPPQNDQVRILIWEDTLPEDAVSDSDVVGAASLKKLHPHLQEAAAIEYLLSHDPLLHDDAVARTELELRLAFHAGRIAALSERLLRSNLQWRVGGKSFSGLQQAISAAMDAAYPKSFVLHNDLINRNRVTGPVSFALRKLLQHLHDQPAQVQLGIVKFPAERIIYESFLRQNKLHVQKPDGTWQLRLIGSDIPDGLRDSLGAMQEHFRRDPQGASASLGQLLQDMALPPYGNKRMPTLLLCVLLLLAHRDQYELYEERHFVPYWGPQTLVRLLKAPERFTIAAAAKSLASNAFMHKYRKVLGGVRRCTGIDMPVVIVRELLIRYSRLSAYAQQTETVSASAQAFRRALKTARSPGDMLFHTIPQALGEKVLPAKGAAGLRYLEQVKQVLVELEMADELLLRRFINVLLEVTKCTSISEARQQCIEYAEQVLQNSHMYHNFAQFLTQIQSESTVAETEWLQALLDKGIGIATPINAWSDAHAAQAEFVLRRNLLGMQHAGDLLGDHEVQHDAMPFAVFWPDPGPAEYTADPTLQQMAALVREIPPEARMSSLINLVKEFKEAV